LADEDTTSQEPTESTASKRELFFSTAKSKRCVIDVLPIPRFGKFTILKKLSFILWICDESEVRNNIFDFLTLEEVYPSHDPIIYMIFDELSFKDT